MYKNTSTIIPTHIVQTSTITSGDILPFLHKHDYTFVEELGQGACGKTVLLHDDQIDEYFVCKKYVPYSESNRIALFNAFIKEIKLLYKVYHENVVRIFNHYLYSEQLSGFILMEYIKGRKIDEYIENFPEQINDVFLQVINGFSYLEQRGILHRDIRPANIMVGNDGRVKIIDLGFGKQIESPKDFEKSISINWWCEPPEEFKKSHYGFSTEIYFIGRLFAKIISDNKMSNFNHSDMLAQMCQYREEDRIKKFADIETAIRKDSFTEIQFATSEINIYREFSFNLFQRLSKIEKTACNNTDIIKIKTQLNNAYRHFMLEPVVPDPSVIISIFIDGNYSYIQKRDWLTQNVKDFLRLLTSATDEKVKIIISNIFSNLDSIPRFEKDYEYDIPF